MPRFKIAHIKVQGVDLIIVLLESGFGHKTKEDQQQAIAELQIHANAADLKGDIAPVWDINRRFCPGLPIDDVVAARVVRKLEASHAIFIKVGLNAPNSAKMAAPRGKVI
jgi:hypothetical protein